MEGRGQALAAARAWLQAAPSVVVLTGAGMSQESGIPTFRDAMTGLWSRFDPAALASEDGWRADPARVWAWYAERRDGVRAAEPNAGHRALAAWQHRHPGRMTVVTQNVDDLHERAGSTGVIRLHGDILADRWFAPCPHDPAGPPQGRNRSASAPRVPGEPACAVESALPGAPPRCGRCGNTVRPAVVWFGEMLPEGAIEAAQQAAEACALMLVVGTSGAVWPAAGLALCARRAGAQVVVVNPHPSELDDVAHLRLAGTAAVVLPALLGRADA